MAGKGKKKRNSKDSTASSGGSGGGDKPSKKGKAKKGKKGGGSAKSSKFQGDMLSESAMENAYLVCHNVMVCINFNTITYVYQINV